MGKKNKFHHRNRSGGLAVVIVGLCLIAPSFIHNGLSSIANGGMAFAGLICVGIGILQLGQELIRNRQLPKKQVMRLAEERHGLLSLSEIATALDIESALAKRTLLALSKDGIATQRWQEFRKNLWEFPDYMRLPISESIEIAKAKGGRLTLDDILALGRSRETAQQTLAALREKGLARPNPAAAEGEVVVTTQ